MLWEFVHDILDGSEREIVGGLRVDNGHRWLNNSGKQDVGRWYIIVFLLSRFDCILIAFGR